MLHSLLHKETAPVQFHCSDDRLNAGFAWAKKRALACVHRADPVGGWFEAALPGRQAFCMRDTAHQSAGAAALGLMDVTKNMLAKFAGSIAESRDFCGYWEIDRRGRPAPVDYVSDADFWYNLPANFDILDACLRQYLWTADEDYLTGEDFTRFYDLTMTAYTQRWDRDGDGILERAPDGSRRGIGSYDEEHSLREAEVMSDMPAVQALGCDLYASLLRLRGEPERALEYAAKAARLRAVLAEKWWDESSRRLYKARFPGGRMVHARPDRQSGADRPPDPAASHMALYFGGLDDPRKLALELDAAAGIQKINVEGLTYLPGLFYRYGQVERAHAFLQRLVHPRLPRRRYPEVSFCIISTLAEGLMGICPIAAPGGLRRLETRPGLPSGMGFARMDALPVWDGHICVAHDGPLTTLENHTSAPIEWSAYTTPADFASEDSAPADSADNSRYPLITQVVGPGEIGRVSRPARANFR